MSSYAQSLCFKLPTNSQPENHQESLDRGGKADHRPNMADPSFMTLRKGSTFRVIEEASGDTSALSGNPTAWLIQADARASDPQPGSPQIPLAVVKEGSRWIATLADTSGLAAPRYFFNTKYSLLDGTFFVPEPTLVVVKP
jgi:hypothetical protein